MPRGYRVIPPFYRNLSKRSGLIHAVKSDNPKATKAVCGANLVPLDPTLMKLQRFQVNLLDACPKCRDRVEKSRATARVAVG